MRWCIFESGRYPWVVPLLKISGREREYRDRDRDYKDRDRDYRDRDRDHRDKERDHRDSRSPRRGRSRSPHRSPRRDRSVAQPAITNLLALPLRDIRCVTCLCATIFS